MLGQHLFVMIIGAGHTIFSRDLIISLTKESDRSQMTSNARTGDPMRTASSVDVFMISCMGVSRRVNR
jgi:hypothetical protein